MDSIENRNNKPTYEELEAICQDLQDKVAQGIKVRQELIEIKNDLDRELNRFKLIEAYSRESLYQDSVEDFGTLTVEYFIQAFEQPNCLLIGYENGSKDLRVQSVFGFDEIKMPRKLDFDESYLPSRDSFFLGTNPRLQDKLSFLNLKLALVCPFFNYNGLFQGIVICGQMEGDGPFYKRFDSKDRYVFTVMAHKAGTLMTNLATSEHLKSEIKVREKVEAELASKTSDLQRSNEELEHFAYIASHDLKSPLRTIALKAQLLQRDHSGNIDPKGLEHLEYISSNLKRYTHVIDDLLEYSKTARQSTRRKFVDIDLIDLVEKIKNEIAPLIDEKKGVILSNGLPAIQGNKVQIEQLFQNLLTNALKFTPGDRKPVIEISAKRNGAYHIFEIKDNGIGIDKEYQDKIFSLFQRVHAEESFEGTGIGLSICKKIVERHNGKIWVESEGEGKGSSFFFTIPFKNDN